MLQSWEAYQYEAQLAGWRTGSYPEIAQLAASSLVTKSVKIIEIEMTTASLADFEHISVDFTLKAPRARGIDRFVGWFVCEFGRGEHKVTLDTSPMAPETHWKQMVFHLEKNREVTRGEKVVGRIDIRTGAGYNREMNVNLQYRTETEKVLNRKDYTVVIVPDTTNWQR